MNQKNDIRIHEIKTWPNYLEVINDRDVRPHGLETQPPTGYSFSRGSIFRGHSDETWKLSSKLERNFTFKAKIGETTEFQDVNLKNMNGPDWYGETCEAILSRFRHNITQIPTHSRTYDENELWALGRHHGLLTPFLDWTYNPYVATFFAFYEAYKLFEAKSTIPGDFGNKKVVVWKLNLWPDTLKENDFEIVEIDAKIDTRLNAQQGLFTVLKNIDYWDIESYLKRRGIADHLEKILLPYEMVLEALKFLDIMGINIFRLFPDYVGAAEQANIQTDAIHLQHTLRKYFPPKKDGLCTVFLILQLIFPFPPNF